MKVALVLALSVLASCDEKRKPEFRSALDRIVTGATSYAKQHGKFPTGEAALTPAADCCNAATRMKCAVDAGAWKVGPWTDLGFAMTEPHYYRYTYSSDGTTFTATAVGDLDCNQDTATFTITGNIGANGVEVAPLVPPPRGHY